MLKLSDIQNKIIINRQKEKVTYFNNSDMKYWNTDKRKIIAFKSFNQYYFILDNISDNTLKMQMYKIKSYDIEKQKVNTILSISDYKVGKAILEALKFNIIAFTEEQKEIINTGELGFSDQLKSMTFYSTYLNNKAFDLYDFR